MKSVFIGGTKESSADRQPQQHPPTQFKQKDIREFGSWESFIELGRVHEVVGDWTLAGLCDVTSLPRRRYVAFRRFERAGDKNNVPFKLWHCADPEGRPAPGRIQSFAPTALMRRPSPAPTLFCLLIYRKGRNSLCRLVIQFRRRHPPVPTPAPVGIDRLTGGLRVG
ncbi:hypothetical protein EVAR_26889_1 [Eumeta japonica]|uniref:Uncharacterized protein n=1 Tax=Eumeta variegata TaxID=151549 RepID=A0A4C1VTX4_EUMVA|nr:hypothetical protein EVAR_26889_1 [Eumeta japonica]